jgi:hypothetical protein
MSTSRPHRFLLLALVLAALVSAPALASGFYDDDYLFLSVLHGVRDDYGPTRFDLYRFVPGVPAQTTALVAEGPLPWWTTPALKAALGRPLASADLALDHALFGLAPFGWHLHSIVWYLALVSVVFALLRRALPAAPAAMAAILFAIDDGHANVVGWIAGRHASISMTFACAGLLAHLRRREEGLRWGLPLSLGAFACGLAAGETALAVLAYVLAYELLAAPGSRRERALALAPLAALAALYLVVYRTAGYGVQGSGAYLDPVGQPLRFLAAMPARVLALLGALTLSTPVDLWTLEARARAGLVGAGLVGVVLFAVLLRRAFRSLAPEEARAARWLGLGALLSLVPVLGGAIGSRLTLVPSLGGAVLVVVALRYAHQASRDASSAPAARRALRVAFGVLLLQHVATGLVGTPFSHVAFGMLGRWADRAAASTEISPAAGAQVVILHGPPTLSVLDTSYHRGIAPETRTAAWNVLSIAPQRHVLTRTAPEAFELAVVGGTMLDTEFERVFRDPDSAPFRVGDRVRLKAGEIEVREVRDGRPTRISLVCERTLEESGLAFMAYRGGVLRRIEMPAVGRTLELSEETLLGSL